MAERIQRRRVKGWRMPAGAVYVGRPSRWGNPYVRSVGGVTPEELYRRWLTLTASGIKIADRARAELAGKDLACWCPVGRPCHADVLIELANGGDRG